MRVYFIFIFFISYSLAAAEPNCKAIYSDKFTAEIVINGRHVNIVGWSHPDPLDDRAAAEQFNKVEALTLAKGCEAAQNSLMEYLENQTELLQKANEVKNKFESIYARHQIDYLGQEASYLETVGLQKRNVEVDMLVSALLKRCPNLRNSVGQFRSLLFWPEYNFAKSKTPVIKVDGIESQLLKSQTWKSISDESIEFFKNDQSKLTAKTLLVLNKIENLIDGTLDSIPDQLIKEAVDAETNLDLKAKLKKALYEINAINVVGKTRNEIIAQNIMARTGNYTILIGQNHLKGLVPILEQKCRNAKSADPKKSLESKGTIAR